MAGTNRAEKLARQIQKDIGDILQKEDFGISRGLLITVTKVRMTPDLKLARLYVSVFPADKASEVLLLLKEKSSQIRFLLGKKIKNQVREIPEIQLFDDDSLDYIERIDDLLQ